MSALIHSFHHSEDSSKDILLSQILSTVPNFPLEAESNSREIFTAMIFLQFKMSPEAPEIL